MMAVPGLLIILNGSLKHSIIIEPMLIGHYYSTLYSIIVGIKNILLSMMTPQNKMLSSRDHVRTEPPSRN